MHKNIENKRVEKITLSKPNVIEKYICKCEGGVCVYFFKAESERERDENIYGGEGGSWWCHWLPFVETLAHEATIRKNRSLNKSDSKQTLDIFQEGKNK